jgi:hypothetical protein
VLGNLVRIVPGGNSGADVKELPDTGRTGQESHRPGQEGAIRARRHRHIRERLDGQVPGRPIDGEIVLAAQPVVINPGKMRHTGIKEERLTAGRHNLPAPFYDH